MDETLRDQTLRRTKMILDNPMSSQESVDLALQVSMYFLKQEAPPLKSAITVNLNDHAIVELTERGQEIWKFYWSGFHVNPDMETHRLPDGRIDLQLWEMMSIFGPAMTIGSKPPFERNRIEIQKS